MKEVKWQDPRKNIYTITVVNKTLGYVAHIETHSNKKKSEARLARLLELWKESKGFEVELHTTKLERKTRWD